MNYIIRKIPILNAIVYIALIVMMGLKNILTLSFTIGLATLSMLCIGYKIAVTDYGKTINPGNFLVGAILGATALGIFAYIIW